MIYPTSSKPPLQKLPIEFTMVNPYFIKTGMFEGVISKWPLVMPMLETGWVGDKVSDKKKFNVNSLKKEKKSDYFDNSKNRLKQVWS